MTYLASLRKKLRTVFALNKKSTYFAIDNQETFFLHKFHGQSRVLREPLEVAMTDQWKQLQELWVSDVVPSTAE